MTNKRKLSLLMYCFFFWTFVKQQQEKDAWNSIGLCLWACFWTFQILTIEVHKLKQQLMMTFSVFRHSLSCFSSLFFENFFHFLLFHVLYFCFGFFHNFFSIYFFFFFPLIHDKIINGTIEKTCITLEWGIN